MKLLSLVLIVCALPLVLASEALAQKPNDLANKIRDLLKEEENIKVKAPIIKNEFIVAVQKKKKSEKERRVYPTKPVLARSVQAWASNFMAVTRNADYVKLQELKKRYVGYGCHQNPVPKRKQTHCSGQYRVIKRDKYQRLEREKLRLEKYGEKLQIISRKIDELDKAIKKQNEIIENRKREYTNINRRLKRIYALVRRFCKMDAARSNPEALRHCHSVDWDGARRDLPPLVFR